MKYGYARVSTKSQARDGNSLESQKLQLLDAGAEIIYCDQFTGKTVDRPELNKLLVELKPGDSLIVTKLDRLGRSVSSVSDLIHNLIQKGVTINVLGLGVLSNDSVNTLMMNVLLCFAQFERDLIVERTREGKEIAKANNPDFKDGRPKKYSKEQIDLALDLLKNHSYTEVTKMTGISRSTLLREKNSRLVTYYEKLTK